MVKTTIKGQRKKRALECFVETAPLVYTSPNAPEKRDVIGTAVLGIVDGTKRFRHFDSLTGDGVSAETFGIKRITRCDSVRLGMLKMDPKTCLAWRSGRTSDASHPS